MNQPIPSPMPTRWQGRMLLNIHWGQSPFGGMPAGRGVPVHGEMRPYKWIMGNRTARLTLAGRDALARWLLRSFTGPVVVVEKQPTMSADEARVLLAILGGSSVYASKHPGYLINRMLDAMCDCGRLDDYDCLTGAGRDALASYLLREWRP